jgi:hypothetical protein
MPDCRNHDRDPEFRYGSVLASRGGSLLTSAEAGASRVVGIGTTDAATLEGGIDLAYTWYP